MSVRTAVLGVGSLGMHHARLLRELPGSELVGVHDTSAPRLEEIGRTLGVTTFADPEALLERVDAAVIAVPTAAHERVARQALERGVHVLIEKPIADSLDAADAILDTARANRALVQIGHVERFNGAVRAAEPYLEEVLFVESHRLAPFGPRGTDVAVVLDLMIHDVDLLLSLMRRPVTGVAATGVPVLTASPDIANARLEFEGGGVANLTASRVSLERMRKFRLFQRSGYLSLDLAAGHGEFLRLREQLRLGPGTGVPPTGLDGLVERIELRGDGREPLAVELEGFLAAVAGEAEVAVSGEDGRRALVVALDIVARIEEHVAHTHPARA